MDPIILGIDPGTKEMGLAVIHGMTLLGGGVKTLRNGERPHDVIGQARQTLLRYIERFSPSVVAIEKPLLLPTSRAAMVSVISQELAARSRELGLRVTLLSPREVRGIVVGNPHARKLDVARELARRFPDLEVKLPKNPPHLVLGYRPGDRYWLHMFDAIAVALGAQATERLPG